MKKLFLFLVTSVTANFSFSQVTFQSSDYADAGDSFLVSTDAELFLKGYNYDTTGTNFLWQFDSLVATTQSFKRQDDPLTTGYKPLICIGPCATKWNAFTNAELLKDTVNILNVMQLYDIYQFYANTGTTYEKRMLGFKTDVLGVPLKYTTDYNDNDVVYEFPILFGNIDSSESSYDIVIPGLLEFHHWQMRTNYVDGWGSLTTPYGNYSSTVRIKSVIYAKDTLELPGQSPIAIPVDSVIEYKWFSLNYGIPVLQVNATVVQGQILYGTAEYIDSLRCLTPIPLFGYLPVPTFLDIYTDSVQVSFLNSTLNCDSLHWNFDDTASGANNISNEYSPTHWYTSQGIYLVQLIGCNTSPACTSLVCDTFTLSVVVIDTTYPYAYFAAVPLSPCLGDTVEFINLSANDTAWFWNFDDPSSGTNDTSTLENPIHIYNSAGTYNVTLIALNSTGTDTFSLAINVASPVSAGFTWSDSITSVPVQFISNSPGANNTWLFTGAKPDSLILSGDTVDVVFGKSDTANVCLLSWESLGCPSLYCENIFIYECLTANFTMNGIAFCINDNITLTNQTSTGLPDAISYQWQQDGVNFSTNTNTVMSFSTPGEHTITLIADNGRCSDTITKTISVKEPAVLYSAGNDTTICVGDTITLNPSYTLGGQVGAVNWSPAVYLSSANTPNPQAFPDTTTNFIFTINVPAGACNVLFSDKDTLTIFVDDGTVNANYSFSIADDSVVTFSDSSTGNIISWQWDFGDGIISSLQNPVHTFNNTGTYIVCLVVSNACGADTVCDTISVLPVRINIISNNGSISVYPNPASDKITIFTTGGNELKIYSVAGQMQITIKLNEGKQSLELNTSNWSSGMYFYSVTTGSGEMLIGKMTKIPE